jgi:hypothetical protein
MLAGIAADSAHPNAEPSMSFRLSGLDPVPFEALFLLPDEELVRRGIRRTVAQPGDTLPCRVSLEEAAAGDELLLLPFEHQPANSPYRASGPIFVRRGVPRRVLPEGEVGPYVTTRLMSLRAYDASDLIVDAAVCEGAAVAAEVERLFANAAVSYIHLHNAKRGCYSCRVDRA